MAGPELKTPGHKRIRLRRPVVDLLIGAMIDVVERDVSSSNTQKSSNKVRFWRREKAKGE